ncbi:MAG TPA: PhzF family phenazine biosynthesis protein, partial [Thermoanaerobaculia bacterium]|nr:PhzF family phenazine biosynthesis protein [Thermoanaerobaculia bacterium]
MRLLQIDAFTSEPFRGNPAAVCLLDRERESPWMQDVAAEMNLSETAFVLPIADGFSLRWFTPSTEVALCGHATLASAHALWEEQLLAPTEVARFHTQSGILTAERRDDLIELDVPATPEEQSDAPAGLLEALGITNPVYVGRNKFDLLVEVESEELVRALAPDHARLRDVPVRGVIVTSRPATSEF